MRTGALSPPGSSAAFSRYAIGVKEPAVVPTATLKIAATCHVLHLLASTHAMKQPDDLRAGQYAKGTDHWLANGCAIDLTHGVTSAKGFGYGDVTEAFYGGAGGCWYS
jgi:hypothetical protein